MKMFTAQDGTEMTFEVVEDVRDILETYGVQRFKIAVKGQADRSIALTELNTEAHYKTLEILLAPGMDIFNTLPLNW